MEVINNTGQSLDFNKSYIITTNYILLFDLYSDYIIKLNEIFSLPEYGQVSGFQLYFNPETNNFYFQ